MSNINNPTGARIVGTLSASMFNGKNTKYIVQATDATPLGLGDLIVSIHGTSDTGLPVCTKASDTGKVRGIIVGFEQDFNYLNQNYRSAYTKRIVLVNDDPHVVFEMQVNGVLTSAQIGNTFDTTTSSVNISTGQSTTQIDLSTSSDTSTIKILGMSQIVNNFLGAYSICICCFAQHELFPNASGSVSTNYWSYNAGSGTIYPSININDNLNIGAGQFRCGLVTIGTLTGILKGIGGVVGGSATTDDLSEGISNLYLTNPRVLASTLSGSYAPSAGTLAPGDAIEVAIAKLDGNFVPEINYWHRNGTELTPETTGDSVNLGSATITCGSAIIGSLSGILKGTTGAVGINATTNDLPESGTPTNLYFTQARSLATELSGAYIASAGTVAIGDALQTAIQKLDGNSSNATVISRVLTGFTSGAGTLSVTDTILSAIQKLDGNIAAISIGSLSDRYLKYVHGETVSTVIPNQGMVYIFDEGGSYALTLAAPLLTQYNRVKITGVDIQSGLPPTITCVTNSYLNQNALFPSAYRSVTLLSNASYIELLCVSNNNWVIIDSNNVTLNA